MEIQHQVRRNAEELQQFLHELNSWEKDMKRKEAALKYNEEVELNIPPIRSKVQKTDDKLPSSINIEMEKESTAAFMDQKKQESLYEKNQGNILAKEKKWVEAIFRYTKAIECYGQDATFYANRAHCYLQLAKWREAETDCSNAIKLDPCFDKAYFRRALALKELHQYCEAKEDFIEVLNLDPKNVRAQTELTHIDNLIIKEERKKKDSMQMAWMEPVVTTESKEEPTNDERKQLAETKKEKGNAFVQKKNWKSAIECYTEACALNPEEPSFYLNRALCFLKTNVPQNTILDCIRVLELDSENVKAYYRRALAYLAIGEDKKAHRDFLKASQLDPSNEDVKKSLHELEVKIGLITAEKPNESKTTTSQLAERTNNDSSEKVPGSGRINGERFLKVGGKRVKPIRKAAHMLSKTPLKNIPISKKCKFELNLKNTLEEIKINGVSVGEPTMTNGSSIQREVSRSKYSQKAENTSSLHADANVPARYKNTNESDNSTAISSVGEENVPAKLIAESSIPRTYLQFTLVWNKLEMCPYWQYQFLKKMGAENFKIFGDSLDCDVFSDILEALNTECVKAGDRAYDFMLNLSRVKRFSALILFALDDDKRCIEELVDYCADHDKITADELESLKETYFY